MKGKVCLITGATNGIGACTAEALARAGATVVLHGRDEARCASTADRIRSATGNDAVSWLRADLSSQADVRRLAADFRQSFDRLDVLVNNAGAQFRNRQRSVDGIEMTLALNHLGYFLLTNELIDLLKASAPSRVVIVSSIGHTYTAGINIDDIQYSKGYGMGWRPYFQSKLANLLFAYELARRLEGTGVTVNALHPGIVKSNFGANNGPGSQLIKSLFYFLFRIKTLTSEEGARTVVYLATAPELEGVTGQYFVDETPVPSSAASHDEAAARRLWEASERLTRESTLSAQPGA